MVSTYLNKLRVVGWRLDRNEEKQITFWGTGYGLRRGHVHIEKVGQVSARKNSYRWIVTIHKNMGYYEDAKVLPVKSFKTKKEALAYAISHMRSHPNG